MRSRSHRRSARAALTGALLTLSALLALGACSSTKAPIPPLVTTFPGGSLDSPNSRINHVVLGQATQEPDRNEAPLGGGDLLEIHVADVPELKDLKVRVTPAGTILLPLLGQLRVEGMTAEELHEKLRTLLAEKYVRNPQVSVSVAEMRSHKVAVMGEVNHPGLFDMNSRMRVADAIGMAGGLKDEASPRVFLIRRQLERAAPTPNEASASPASAKAAKALPPGALAPGMVEIDLRELLDGKADRGNLLLRPGDIVEVPRAGTVYVGGNVKNPKAVDILGGKMTTQQAIIAAGGPTQLAAMAKVRVYRLLPSGQRQEIKLDLSKNNSARIDFPVQKDDVVMVGTSGAMVALTTLKDLMYPAIMAAWLFGL
ncbi:polysaccharide biosynthesis/export family protein [Methylacidimicrobium sp. B4]|uniref:SLBB domain-containing protein n=1 Tax=Methylacidimicrobium sp. B4 TaxID=2796139 RepID=UPI001A9023D2|nr:polysaccharide biosynthesis/export family protein [Methylacidimicrobium sp. B4]QSR85464.1 SLBB domain-containing protein [Methylacidimicrobium sp. B4]